MNAFSHGTDGLRLLDVGSLVCPTTAEGALASCKFLGKERSRIMRVRRATIVVRVVLSEGLTAQEDDLLKRVQHKLRPEQLQQKVNALLMGESTVERLFGNPERWRKGFKW